MNRLLFCLLLAASLLSTEATATDAVANTPSDALPNGQIVTTFARDRFIEQLRRSPLFANLSTEQKFGSPMLVRITHTLAPTTAGKVDALVSVWWYAGSLGLLPAVLNQDLHVTFELLLNQSNILTRSYVHNFTKAQAIYLKNKIGQIPDSSVDWAVQKTADFVAEAQADASVHQVVNDFNTYFPDAAAHSAAASATPASPPDNKPANAPEAKGGNESGGAAGSAVPP